MVLDEASLLKIIGMYISFTHPGARIFLLTAHILPQDGNLQISRFDYRVAHSIPIMFFLGGTRILDSFR